MSRADLIRVANMYFTGMQKNDGLGEYPFASDCDRFENASQSTNAETPPKPDSSGSKDSDDVFRAVELHGAVQVGIDSLRVAHP
jgi:hypothetical protein